MPEPEKVEREVEGPAEEVGVFTRFVRGLDPGRQPEPGLISEAWSAFRRAVRRELGRRSLSQSSPQWLGIYGFRGWWDDPGPGGPFEELVAECYRFVFVDRFPAIKAQAETRSKPNIEGVVIGSIRNFLHDRQRLHDRLGSRLFEVLRRAARLAVVRGELRVLSGPEKIFNSTVLSTDERSVAQEIAGPELLATLVKRWNDELLPHLATATRTEKSLLIEDLSRRLGELDLEGVAAFRFGDLIAPLKADIRSRWATLAETVEEDATPGEEGGREVQRFLRLGRSLESSVEDRMIAADRFTKLIDCVDSLIEAHAASEKTRRYLQRMLLFYRGYSLDDGEREMPGKGIEDARLPSFRRLALHLKIPRERLEELKGTLGEFLRRCLERLDREVWRFAPGSPPLREVRT